MHTCAHSSLRFLRKGQFLTKEDSGYASNDVDAIGSSSVLHNTLALENTATNPGYTIALSNMNAGELQPLSNMNAGELEHSAT